MLRNSALLLILLALNFCLHALSAHKFGLAQLFVCNLMFFELFDLVFFDDFNSGEFE